MSKYLVDIRDVDFIINEYLSLNKLCDFSRFKNLDYDSTLLNDIVTQGLKFSQEVLAPANKEGDTIGAKIENGLVKVPECYREPYRLYVGNGWGSTTSNPDYGGMGIPELVSTCIGEFVSGSNCAFAMMPSLTKSAAFVIDQCGSYEQKQKYLEKMLAGEWAGTMCLTESQAGSDVGACSTKAIPIEGKANAYNIVGGKQFISFGDNNFTKNIIHLVLARTPGAPAGIKGVGLFIVPKHKIIEDGAIGKDNDVSCSGIEHKMGIHGSPTCVLNFGDNDSCEGELIGDAYSGIKYMFLMMNEERLMVGMQAMSMAGAAYQATLKFAQERVQSVGIGASHDSSVNSVTIDQHPDVRRMLMTMKAYTEGMRALLYNTAYAIDIAHWSDDLKERNKYAGFVEILTPICKAYCSDTSFRVTELAMQTHGGYGYCTEYPVEQYCRDTKITSIYEGTNAIQALDLLGRKLSMKNGEVLNSFLQDIKERMVKLKSNKETIFMAQKLEIVFDKIKIIIAEFKVLLKKETALGVIPFINACDLLEMFGDFLLGFYLTEQAAICADKLNAICKKNGVKNTGAMNLLIEDNPDAFYYHSKIKTADFFCNMLLPRIIWKESSIFSKNTSCLDNVFKNIAS